MVELLVKMGYGGSIAEAGKAIGKTGDEGIDGMIKEDQLGLGVIYLQAKKWEGTVGRPEIQKFAGALQGKSARNDAHFEKSGDIGGSGDIFRLYLVRLVIHRLILTRPLSMEC